jgi:hypothetical protein
MSRVSSVLWLGNLAPSGWQRPVHRGGRLPGDQLSRLPRPPGMRPGWYDLLGRMGRLGGSAFA